MKRTLPQSLALYCGLALLVLVIGLPFWWVVTGSIKLPREIISRIPTMVPHSFTPQHFEKLFQSTDFPAYLVNSLVVALFSTAFTIALALPAAYAFFRMEFPGRAALYRVILLAYAFPSVVVLIPIYGLFARLGLIDTRTSLVIVTHDATLAASCRRRLLLRDGRLGPAEASAAPGAHQPDAPGEAHAEIADDGEDARQ